MRSVEEKSREEVENDRMCTRQNLTSSALSPDGRRSSLEAGQGGVLMAEPEAMLESDAPVGGLLNEFEIKAFHCEQGLLRPREKKRHQTIRQRHKMRHGAGTNGVAPFPEDVDALLGEATGSKRRRFRVVGLATTVGEDEERGLPTASAMDSGEICKHQSHEHRSKIQDRIRCWL